MANELGTIKSDDVLPGAAVEDAIVYVATQTPALGIATLLNAPSFLAGNPSAWLRVSINGTEYTIPMWPAS